MISEAQARKIRTVIEERATTLSDETALEVPEMFPKWIPRDYAIGDRVRFEGTLYKCVQAHSSNETWTPADAHSLWARVINEGVPEWQQPDSTNPYMKGDRVKHDGQIWESDIDNNVWEPGVYGWSVVE